MKAFWIPRHFGLAILIGAALALTGAGALMAAQHMRTKVEAKAQAAIQKRRAVQTKLSQATHEQSEIGAKLDEYRRLLTRGVIGAEHRLDWVDALLIVREENRLPDLKYSIGPQKPLNYPEVPQSTEVETLTSPMTLELAMLHEGDLFRVLAGLRGRLPPHMNVTDCMIERNSAATTAARLRATCVVDLITIRDRNVGGAP